MRSPRPPRLQILLAGLMLAGLALLSLAPVLAQPGFFGYSRVALPLVTRPLPPTPMPTPVPPAPPRIVAWLDIPGQVRINDRMQVIVNIENQGNVDFDGRTEVIIPYDGRRFEAVDSSFDRGRGDWVKQNRFPTDITVEFGPLRRGEFRRGVIYYERSYLVAFDPAFGGGAGGYAPELYDNAATPEAAAPINVAGTTPVTGINAGLARLP